MSTSFQEDGIGQVFEEMDQLMERILVMYEKMNTLTSELDAIGESPPE